MTDRLHHKLYDQLDDWEGRDIVTEAKRNAPPHGHVEAWQDWYESKFFFKDEALGHGTACQILMDNILYVTVHWGANTIDALKIYGRKTRLDHHANFYGEQLCEHLLNIAKWQPEQYSPTYNYLCALYALDHDNEDRYIYRLEQTIANLKHYHTSPRELLKIAEDELSGRFPKGLPRA